MLGGGAGGIELVESSPEPATMPAVVRWPGGLVAGSGPWWNGCGGVAVSRVTLVSWWGGG